MNIPLNIRSQVQPEFQPGFGLRQSAGVLEARNLPALVTSGRIKRPSKTLPRISPLLLRWFTWYSRRYLRHHFHSLRVSQTGLPPASDELPLVVYANHASWWDALVFLVTKDQFFSDRAAFAPIDAAMLERYKFFRKLGFFGVQQNAQGGAIQFLRVAEALLESPQTLLAITPQSRFVDVRERPLRFAPGLGHLATRTQQAAFVPFAVEYVFWEERLPEILIRFGEPLEIRSASRTNSNADYWTARFEQQLTKTQEDLALGAQRRDPAGFQILLSGGAGQGGVYDWWRFWKAGVRGETFRKEHGNK
jgi:1-acyl-sn-glycerol-3-phosphate acyltransferase